MGLRQRIWARRQFVRLFKLLGDQCAWCGVTAPLEFDCIEPMGPVHHRSGPSARACFYRRMYSIGNLQVLCFDCHRRKTMMEREAEQLHFL